MQADEESASGTSASRLGQAQIVQQLNPCCPLPSPCVTLSVES